jgi:ribonuclease HI
MKKLKLEHELATMVLNGEKTTTWRIFDDKDLSVNDRVVLIDKVDPEKPQTWKNIGVATIKRVVQKRLGDIEGADFDGHEAFASRDEMLATYQKYYGSDVSWETPVKILDFDFAVGEVETSEPAHHDKVIVYADGGSRGNPGPSAAGYIIMDGQQNVLVDKGVYLGITTNNQAEYQALKSALEEAHIMGATEVSVYMDSMLVVNQMKRIFKVKNRDLWPIHDAITRLVSGFQKVQFTQIPRELNKLADAAVNRVLDEAVKKFREQ